MYHRARHDCALSIVCEAAYRNDAAAVCSKKGVGVRLPTDGTDEVAGLGSTRNSLLLCACSAHRRLSEVPLRNWL